MNNRFVRLTFLIVSILMCVGLLRSILENFQRTDLVGQRQLALQEEEQKNATLRDQLRNATSAAFIEEEARNKLGLVRQGDTVVFLSNPSPNETLPEQKISNLTRWQQWWSLFF